MLLNIDNPVYNTIIVFSVIMLILYTTKPEVIYDNKKNEFRQFGTTDGKTLLPIYVLGILLAIILYVFFYYLSIKNNIDFVDSDSNSNLTQNNNVVYYHKPITNKARNDRVNKTHIIADRGKTDDEYKYLQQQIQLQNIQNQLNHLMQQQVTSQLLMNQNTLQTTSNNPNLKTDSCLPNSLNV